MCVHVCVGLKVRTGIILTLFYLIHRGKVFQSNPELMESSLTGQLALGNAQWSGLTRPLSSYMAVTWL